MAMCPHYFVIGLNSKFEICIHFVQHHFGVRMTHFTQHYDIVLPKGSSMSFWENVMIGKLSQRKFFSIAPSHADAECRPFL
jgi:hypothetical protein